MPYSWDMFAIRLDRCVVGWAPPLAIEGERVATWHDRAYALEFDTIYDHARQYAAAALAACAFRTSARTRVTLTCAESDGTMATDAVGCP